MRVLVTGASGFIGREVTKRLCADGIDVHATARTPIALPGVAWHCVDLMDSDQTELLLSQIRPTHLLHLAWCTEPGLFWATPANTEWENASKQLFELFIAHGGKRFVGAGSCAEYTWNVDVCRESIADGLPATLYGQSKLRTWNHIKARSREEDISSAWGRIFWLYGPNEHQSRLIPYVITNILQGLDVNCTNGEQVRDFMHLFDVADAFVRLTKMDVAGPVNIASGTPVQLRDIIMHIANRLSAPQLIKLGALKTKESEPHSVTADVEKLRTLLKFQPSIKLNDGLDDAISWWKTNLNVAVACK